MVSAVQAVEAMARARGDAVVFSTMSALKEWGAVSTRRELDVDVRGAMGKAAPMALGLALAQPERRVIVLDGDGSLLMNLGTLVTIGSLAPPNLVHVVFEDGQYTTTGGQPTPGSGRVDLVAMARAAGYKQAWAIDTLEELEARLPEAMSAAGPVFMALRVRHPARLPPFPGRTAGESMREVRASLGVGRKQPVKAG